MKLRKQRCFALLLALVLSFSLLGTGAYAAGDGHTYKFSLLADEQVDTLAATGDIVPVKLILTNTTASGNYDLYTMQDYVTFDTSFFELVDGSIETLTQGLEQFAYDEVYCRKYRYAIVETIVAQCDALTQENCWFSAGDRQGAFELLNSYLLNPDYADQKILRAKLQEVAQESVTYELAAAESALGLGETSPVLNRIADNIAKASFRDASIRSSKVYAMKICSEDAGVRSLLGDRVLGEQAEAVLIGESVMSAADFAAKARAKVDAYRDKPWIAAGLGRYYSEKERKFTWTVMLLYETIEAEEE